MKKLICYLICGSLLFSQEAVAQAPWDIAYHAVPSTPVLNMPEEVAEISGNAQSAINQSKQIVMTAKTDATNLQKAATATFTAISSGALILSVVSSPGQNEYTFCGKNLDKVKTKKIAKKMKQVFLTFKSKKSADIHKQRKAREKFYMDNLSAIYAATLVLQQELKTEVKAKTDEAKICAKGKGCSGLPVSSEGENETLFIYGKTLEAFDSVVRLWESVSALKARLTAIEIMNQIEPTMETKADKADTSSTDDKKTSALSDKNVLPTGVFSLHSNQKLAFAQVGYKKVSTSLSNVEAVVSGRKSEATSLVSQTVQFASPAESSREHPLASAGEKLKALSDVSKVEDVVTQAMDTHNMLKELESYRETAQQFAEMKKEYDESLKKLQESEQCAIKYLGKYFNDPVKVWSGISLGKNVYNHDLRKGISGWAFEAFETAKSAETSSITTDDLSLASLDAKDRDSLVDDPDFSKSERQSQKIVNNLSKSKQEKAQDENRKASLVSWQIGAEASKVLSSEASSWGSPIKKRMVWTDTKNFYRQYLRRKYDNIKSYLKVYTRSDVLALVVSRIKGKKQDISQTNYQKQHAAATKKTSDELVANMNDVASSVKQILNEKNSAVAALQKQRAGLVAKMDEISVSIKDNNNKIADIRSTASNKALEKMDEALNAKVVFPTSGNGSTTKVKILSPSKIDKTISADEKSETDDKKITSLEKAVKKDQTTLDNYQKQLDALDKKIAETKLAAQEKASTTLGDKASASETIQNTLSEGLKVADVKYAGDVRANLMAILTASSLANPLLNPAAMMAMAEESADISLRLLYQQVDAAVDGGYQQMLALGDELYTGEAQEKVVAIHNQIINTVKELTLAYSVAGLIKINNVKAYIKLAEVDTSVETEGFFVGATPKERDLKAPFAIPNLDSPPVREVFHFDSVDFSTIKPKVKGKKSGRKITASEFLDFGGDIPEIWRYMLQDKAFVESNYNLEEALNVGCKKIIVPSTGLTGLKPQNLTKTICCENVAFSRGGIMPCVVEGSSIVVDVNSKGEYIKRNDISVSSVPKCLLIEMKKGRPHHTFMDADVEFVSTSKVGGIAKLVASGGFSDAYVEEPWSRNCEYSELGMLLEADKHNNLSFRERAFDAYNDLLEETNGNISNKQKNKIASAYHASISRNQIGDFLRQAENEKLMRENLEEYKQKYDKQMEGLKERLAKHGFKPSASFDLAKDSDYKLALNKLKEIKNKQMKSANSAITKVDVSDNAPAQEKAKNFNKIISTMKKDENGLLNVSITTSDDNDINSQLRKAKTDAAVVDKYKNSLKNKGKEYNDIEQPFCANY